MVAEAGRLLAAAERRRLPAEVALEGVGGKDRLTPFYLGLWAKITSGDVRHCELHVQGEWGQVDAAGNAYRLEILPGSDSTLHRFDPLGRCTASSPYPHGTNPENCSSRILAASGGAYEFTLGRGGLVITRWEVEE